MQNVNKITPTLKRWALTFALNCMSVNPLPEPRIQLIPSSPMADNFHWELLQNGDLRGTRDTNQIVLGPIRERHLFFPKYYSGTEAHYLFDKLRAQAASTGISCTSMAVFAYPWEMTTPIQPNRIRRWIDIKLERSRDDQVGLRYLIAKLDKHRQRFGDWEDAVQQAGFET